MNDYLTILYNDLVNNTREETRMKDYERFFTVTSTPKSGRKVTPKEEAMREAATDTAAALGFISAIGAIGGFFIPKAFGISLDLTGSPAGAMKVFLIFYIACVVITWLVYGRNTKKNK